MSWNVPTTTTAGTLRWEPPLLPDGWGYRIEGSTLYIFQLPRA